MDDIVKITADDKAVLRLNLLLVKMNTNHGERGRFSSGGGLINAVDKEPGFLNDAISSLPRTKDEINARKAIRPKDIPGETIANALHNISGEGSLYAEMQDYLRNERNAINTEEAANDQENPYFQLENEYRNIMAIARELPRDVMLYRGVAASDNVKPGAVLLDKGFGFTSTARSVAEYHSSTKGGPNSQLLFIRANKGTPYIFGNDSESEIILPPMTRVVVDKIVGKNVLAHVELDNVSKKNVTLVDFGKANPYHDERGRFTTRDGVASAVSAVMNSQGWSKSKVEKVAAGGANYKEKKQCDRLARLESDIYESGSAVENALLKIFETQDKKNTAEFLSSITNGSVSKSIKELGNMALYDLKVLSSITWKKGGTENAVCYLANRSINAGENGATGDIRHELGHAVLSAMSEHGYTSLTKAIKDSYDTAKKKAEANPKGMYEKQTHEWYKKNYGVPSRRSMDNIHEFFAENYRVFQRQHYRELYEGEKGAVEAYRKTFPEMAKVFDAHYTAALIAQKSEPSIKKLADFLIEKYNPYHDERGRFATAPNPANLVQKSGPKGSNPGGWYQDKETGKSYYVKFYKNPDQGSTEWIANRILNELDIRTPATYLLEINGKKAVASLSVPGVENDTSKNLGREQDVIDAFVANAYIANWDVAGIDMTNTARSSKGIIQMDNGGSLFFRAQGGPKNFGEKVEELETLRNPKINPNTTNLFRKVTDDDIKKQVALLNKKMTDDFIERTVIDSKISNPSKVIVALKDRRDWLVNKYLGKLSKAVSIALRGPMAPMTMDQVNSHRMSDIQFALLVKMNENHDPSNGEFAYGDTPGLSEKQKKGVKGKHIAIDPSSDAIYWNGHWAGTLMEHHGKWWITYPDKSVSSHGYATKAAAAKHAAFHALKYEGTSKGGVKIDGLNTEGLMSFKSLKGAEKPQEQFMKPYTEQPKSTVQFGTPMNVPAKEPPKDLPNGKTLGVHNVAYPATKEADDEFLNPDGRDTRAQGVWNKIATMFKAFSDNKAAEAIAQKFGGTKETILSLWSSWNGTSNGSNQSLRLQMAVADIFGTPQLSKWQQEHIDEMGDKKWKDAADIRASVAAVYKSTQEILADAGIKEITLYRGTGKGSAQNVDWSKVKKGDSVDIQMNAAESWSMNPHYAKTWGSIGLKITVPASRILGFGYNGLGTKYEEEWVIMGDKERDRATIIRFPD